MRKPALYSGLLLVTTIVAINTSKASALDPAKLLVIEKQNQITLINKEVMVKSEESEPEPIQNKSQEYTTEEGDTLSSIATKFNSTWNRLYDKNTQIEMPDVIKAGEKISIPTADEQLISRPIPAPESVESVSLPTVKKLNGYSAPRVSTNSSVASRGSSAGNTYGYGYCTWYVKSRRPDLPNNLGNADTWVARAAAQGLATGSIPRTGAVGQSGMHVVYVEAINGDGTITISEMNHDGWNVINSRVVAANYFSYIY